MSATVLRFNNRTTRVPNAYVRVDASGLESPPAGATGRVLLIGTATGGVPWSEIEDAEDVVSFSTSDALRRAFRGGDLREAGNMAFTPSRDPNITGAQEVIAIKVDPSTAASLTLANALGNSLLVRSRDYGPHVNQIAYSQAPGSSQGYQVTVTFEDVSETRDNIGGVPLVTLQYTEPPSVGWDLMVASLTAGGLRSDGTRTETGRAAELLNPSTNTAIEVLSSSAGDVGQVVTVYGRVAGTVTARQLVLNGTSVVADAGTPFDATEIYGATLSAAAVGTVTVRHAGPTNLFQFAPGDLDQGGVRGVGMYATGAITFVADAATTVGIIVAGRNTSGAVVLERLALNGTTPVSTVTTTWSQVDFLALALLPGARTLTTTAIAAQTAHATQDTLQKLADYYNALQVTVSGTVYGFEAVLGTTRTAFDPADLDRTPVASPVNVDDPATGGFLADNFLIAEYLTDESVYVTGEVVSGAFGAPSNTLSPAFLSGGTQGTPLFSDWAGALNLAREVDCDTVVCLTPDPAVHAELVAHVDFMSGPGRGERDAVIGVMNAAMTGLATFSEIRAQIAAINNRNVRVVAQQIDRFNTEAVAVRTTFQPHFLAALVAGAQAGIALGRSLTHAVLNVQRFGQHSSWSPVDQVEEALENGLVFLQREKGIGIRVVRDITSAVGSENIAFTDGAANRIVNFVSRELRTNLDTFVASPGFSGTRAAIEGRARKKLNEFVNTEKILREWKDLVVGISSDQAPVSVQVAPAFAVNFLPATIFLYDAPVTA